MKSQTAVSSSPASESGTSRNASAAASLALLSIGHFCIDLYGSALGALQPFLVEKLRLSLSQAGVIGGLLILSSSVTQPIYGLLADRLQSRLFTTLAPALAAICICALGLAPDYAALLVLVTLGGIGIAAFHPQASALATADAGTRRATAMSIFVTAGTLGMALGPTYFTALVGWLGLQGSLWGSVPGVLTSIALIWLLRTQTGPGTNSMSRGIDWDEIRRIRKPLTILYFLVFIRSIVQVTFGQFLPLYLHRERGMTIAEGNHVLSAYLAAGAIGGFLGGHLADRYGGRRVIMASMVGSVPLLWVFFLSSGVPAILGLMLGGLILLFTFPVNVVMAQELAPRQAGTVSALTMGFAWGMAGLVFIPLSGAVADRIGMHTTLQLLLIFPIGGFLLARMLPRRPA